MNDPRYVHKEDFFSLQKPKEKIKFLLNYAILAPSTHNSQPWLFKIDNSSCKIFYDPRKAIKEADPVERDLYISFGCLIENLVIAAKYFGVFKDIKYFRHDQDKLIGEIFFQNLDKKQSLSFVDRSLEDFIAAVPERVNTRGLFEKKSVESAIIQKIVALNILSNLQLSIITDSQKIEELARLTAQGLEMAYSKTEFREEMSHWINNSISKRREGIPGYSLRMPFLMSFIFPGLVRRFNIGRKVGKLNYISIASAPAVVVISAKEDNPSVWLETGRLSERIMLEALVQGLKTSIFIASIEMGELYRKVQKVIGTELRPQFLMCIGYMNFNQKPNLRHPVESKLIE